MVEQHPALVGARFGGEERYRKSNALADQQSERVEAGKECRFTRLHPSDDEWPQPVVARNRLSRNNCVA